jgi:hypothetical protein
MSYVRTFGWLVVFVGLTCTSYAQEFPIAVGDDDTFSGGGAFDGTNYCVMIWGDNASPNSITAQFVSRTGSLVGQRISLGHTGSNPIVAFDGSNYLAVWSDVFPRMASGDTNGTGNIYGQFISPAGSLVGQSFTLVTGVNIKFAQGRGGLIFKDTTYLLTYCKGGNHTDHVYGQRVSRSGSLLGGPIQISEGYGREVAVDFDGTNYLVAWCKVAYPNVDTEIWGQFVSKSAELVGTNFLIDGGEYASDNPVSMTYDGSKFWVAFHEQAADPSDRWNLYARFVSPSGVITNRFLICDSTKSPTFASAAFDGTRYLITWMEFAAMPCVKGRFFSASGIPEDSAFTVFSELAGKFPVGGVGGYIDGNFLLSATRIDQNMANGDIYWLFIPNSSTGVNEGKASLNPGTFSLFQNYPNPFNPQTTIGYSLSHRSQVTLAIFNTLGQQVATLVNGDIDAGYHSVQFDGSNLASGIYYYRLHAGTFVETRKLLLIR